MLLTRMGNKRKIAALLEPMFPDHTLYIEPFFGAGGMYFNRKQRAKYNIVNDNDSEVFNLFCVLRERHTEFIEAFTQTPIHADLWKYWKTLTPVDPVWRAVRFVMYSNYSFMAKYSTMRYNRKNTTKNIIARVAATWEALRGVEFMNCDFRTMFAKIPLRRNERSQTFIYADPPYLDTTNEYPTQFTRADSYDLFDTLVETGCRFAMSEFDHPFIIDEAKRRGLIINIVGERQNLKNRRTEILITNYDPPCITNN